MGKNLIRISKAEWWAIAQRIYVGADPCGQCVDAQLCANGTPTGCQKRIAWMNRYDQARKNGLRAELLPLREQYQASFEYVDQIQQNNKEIERLRQENERLRNKIEEIQTEVRGKVQIARDKK